MLEVAPADPAREDWPALLALILRAFAYMEGRIDPPSSALRLTPERLRAEAESGTLFLARQDGDPVGCLLCRPRGQALYLSKLAVEPDRQGQGIARALLAAAEAEARRRGLPVLELQTRIELGENHAAFAALGFQRVGETAHPGFDRPTSLTLQKRLEGRPS